MPSRRQILGGLLGFCGHALPPALAWAAPQEYLLDPDQTKVGFGFRLNKIWQTGTMPVVSSAIQLTPNHLEATKVSVSLDARSAKAGFIFATRAMTGPEVLDVARFPTIDFISRQIQLGPGRRLSGGAHILGDLTLRGVTQPISLAASLFRPAGSAVDDLSRLDFNLTGRLSRAAYGASGFAALVQDEVRLDIRASLYQAT